MKSLPRITVPQRIGLGVIAFFYGEAVAAPLFVLAIFLRFPSNIHALAHHPRFTLIYLVTVTAFEGLTSAIAWMAFGSILVACWAPERMRQEKGFYYATAVPLALLASAMLALVLAQIHAAHPQMPRISWPLFFETSGFMLVSSAVALNRYLKMSLQADALLAKGGQFEF